MISKSNINRVIIPSSKEPGRARSLCSFSPDAWDEEKEEKEQEEQDSSLRSIPTSCADEATIWLIRGQPKFKQRTNLKKIYISCTKLGHIQRLHRGRGRLEISGEEGWPWWW